VGGDRQEAPPWRQRTWTSRRQLPGRRTALPPSGAPRSRLRRARARRRPPRAARQPPSRRCRVPAPGTPRPSPRREARATPEARTLCPRAGSCRREAGLPGRTCPASRSRPRLKPRNAQSGVRVRAPSRRSVLSLVQAKTAYKARPAAQPPALLESLHAARSTQTRRRHLRDPRLRLQGLGRPEIHQLRTGNAVRALRMMMMMMMTLNDLHQEVQLLARGRRQVMIDCRQQEAPVRVRCGNGRLLKVVHQHHRFKHHRSHTLTRTWQSRPWKCHQVTQACMEACRAREYASTWKATTAYRASLAGPQQISSSPRHTCAQPIAMDALGMARPTALVKRDWRTLLCGLPCRCWMDHSSRATGVARTAAPQSRDVQNLDHRTAFEASAGACPCHACRRSTGDRERPLEGGSLEGQSRLQSHPRGQRRKMPVSQMRLLHRSSHRPLRRALP